MTTPEIVAVLTRMRNAARARYLVSIERTQQPHRQMELDGHLKDAWDRTTEVDTIDAVLEMLGAKP